MIRFLASILLSLVISASCRAACEIRVWEQKSFASDAIHYTTADLDGDGVSEIISASSTTLSYRRVPALTPVTIYSATAIGAPVAGDVTGDGKIDLVVPNDSSDSLVVLPGNGNATFAAPVITNLTVSPRRFVLGNFTGNANLDVALIGDSASSPLVFLQGDGTGAFTLAGTVSIAASPLNLTSTDFDKDGYADVVVSHAGSTGMEILFSNGSGGATILSLYGGDSAVLAVVDFDEDGDDDLLTVRPAGNRLIVFLNGGARDLVPSYEHVLWPISNETPQSMALGDFDGDLDLDVAVGRPGSIDWVLRSEDGDYYYPWSNWNSERPFPWDRKNEGRSIATADFDQDGLTDVVVENANAGSGVLLMNECSTVAVDISTPHKITLGQELEVQVDISGNNEAAPTGTITLSGPVGETTMTLPPSPYHGRTRVTLNVDGLPLGFHAIEVEYSGDATNLPARNTRYVTVTTESTTTILTGPTEWTYGEKPQLTASVTSSSGDTPTGRIVFLLEGASRNEEAAPIGTWDAYPVSAGTHTIEAGLLYSETHPTSIDSMQVTVKKAKSEISLRSGSLSLYGEPASIEPTITPLSPFPVVTGYVKVMKGATTLTFTHVSSQQTFGLQPTLFVNGLEAGSHTLRVVFEGDANNESSSLELEHRVMPADTALPLFATGQNGQVTLEVLIPSIHYPPINVYRRTVNGPWNFVGAVPFRLLADTNVVAGQSYQYRAETGGANGTRLHSNVETVYAGSFTDASLSGAKIRKTHFTEVQTAINGFRAFAGLAPLQIDFTGLVRASHLTQMRTAINDARVALGMPSFAFGSAPVAGATVIRALDLDQLRAAVR